MSAEDVLSSLSAGVIVIAQDGAIVFANEAAAKILRQPVERLLECNLAELLPVALASTAEARREVEIELVDGSQTNVGFTMSAPNADGARTVLFQEITAVLELRQERDRLLQLAALGDALPSILHELRNPLAAVTSSLEVLIEESDDALRDDLHTILWEVRRMNLTLQGVGGLVRPMHAKQHVAVDLAVSEACRILAPTAHRRGVDLRAEIPSMPLVPLDWGVISGVVFNLVKNAIDACEEGDMIVVSTRLDDDTFVLTVADSGAGMSPEVLARCRELFYTSKANGSGIGLALCQQIAMGSGGTLSIESEPGRGTSVEIAVPLHPPKSSRPRLSAVRNQTMAALRRRSEGEKVSKCLV